MSHFLKVLSFFIIIFWWMPMAVWAADYHYEIFKKNNHIIHVASINPKIYTINIVKAQNTALGRETVASMAERSHADIAINAGFFELSEHKEGKASGSLIIKNKVYGLRNKMQALIVIDEDQLRIKKANAKNILENKKSSELSLVSGLPLLIQNGKISEEISGKKSVFYTKAHARTALGLQADGTIKIVVVEHRYAVDLNSTIREIPVLLSAHSNWTWESAKKTFKEKFIKKQSVQGLTITELAIFMKKLGCKNAINLDGGGSSTLWMDGKVVNQTIGDKDEGFGFQVVRPVSDAIIFKQNKKSI